MTRAECIAMIRATHYAEHVAIAARDDHDVPCVIGRDDAAQEIARPTVATRDPWGMR